MPICKFFLEGSCRFGNNCRFEHRNVPQDYRQQSQVNHGREICRFYAQGTCRFGSSCRFEHPQDHGGQRNSQSVQSQTPTDAELLATISQEMEIWEKSRMWPLSCFGYTKAVKSLPGLEDHSFEELRHKAYEAKQASNFDAYLQWVTQLVNDASSKKQLLKRMDANFKQQLIQIIHTAPKSGDGTSSGALSQQKPSFASTNSTFGSGGNTGAFGQQSQPSTVQPSIFSRLGAPAAAAGAAAAATPSVFGGAPANSTSQPFRSQTQNPQSVFGGSGSAGSVFGGASTSFLQSVNPFGAAAAAVGNTAMASTQPVAAPSPFAQSAAAVSNSPLASKDPRQAANPFGGAIGAPALPPASIFGTSSVFGAQNNAAAAPSASVFGGASSASILGAPPVNQAKAGLLPTPSSAPLFGKPALATGPPQNPAFSNVTQTASPFAQPAMAPSAFGQPAQKQPQPQPQPQLQPQPPVQSAPVQSAPVTGAHDTTYTPLDQLTADERTQFEAPKFILGQIPTRPPPKEMI